MRLRGLSRSARPIRFESYGVSIRVTPEDADLAAAVEALLPENRRPWKDDGDPDLRYELKSDGAGGFDVTAGDANVCMSGELDVALNVLETQMRTGIAIRATVGIFVHAGVVAFRGQVVLVPGSSFSGKTTLVKALVEAGADYLSDEYAVLDEHGLAHPYPKPLSLRNPGTAERTESRVESLGGEQEERPLPVGLILVTGFRPGAVWEPQPASAGQGALTLLENTVPARLRPEEAMKAVRAAADGAIVLEGERGEAAEAAPEILAALEEAPAPAH